MSQLVQNKFGLELYHIPVGLSTPMRCFAYTVQVFPNRLCIAMYVSEVERLGFEVHLERACEETSLAHDPIYLSH